MQLYRYDKITKEYIGELPALPDPLASKAAGTTIYVIPPYCTTIKPKLEEGKKAFFNGEGWDITFDYRGRVIYKKTNGAREVITELGDIPKGYTFEKPVVLQDLKMEKVQEVSNKARQILEEKVDFGKLKAAISERIVFLHMLSNLGDKKFCVYTNGEEKSVLLKKEDLDDIEKRLYLVGILIPIKKDQIIKEIRKAKSKKELSAIELNFDISKELEECLQMTDQELNEFIERSMK